MEHKIGDTVYYPKYDNRQVREPCPVCYGKLAITVVLGNGDEISVPCTYCGLGYEPPKGYTMEWTNDPKVEKAVVIGMSVKETHEGRVVDYYETTAGGRARPEDLFVTEEECMTEAIRRVEKMLDAEDARRIRKKDNLEKVGWNVGYHLREAREMRRKIQYHEERAKVLKNRNKEIKNVKAD